MGLDRIINPAIKILGGILIAGTIAVTSLGCSKENKVQEKASSIIVQGKLPLWSSDDLEINKLGGNGYVYDVQVFQKPPFYNGKMPLEYEILKTPDYGGFSGGLSKALVNRFKDFSNYFIYDGFSLVGAVAVNNDKLLLAEARVIPYIQKEGEPYSFERQAEEFHYDNGLLTFHCVSGFDDLGFKKEEKQAAGKKKKDYFFIMPLGIDSY